METIPPDATFSVRSTPVSMHPFSRVPICTGLRLHPSHPNTVHQTHKLSSGHLRSDIDASLHRAGMIKNIAQILLAAANVLVHELRSRYYRQRSCRAQEFAQRSCQQGFAASRRTVQQHPPNGRDPEFLQHLRRRRQGRPNASFEFGNLRFQSPHAQSHGVVKSGSRQGHDFGREGLGECYSILRHEVCARGFIAVLSTSSFFLFLFFLLLLLFLLFFLFFAVAAPVEFGVLIFPWRFSKQPEEQ